MNLEVKLECTADKTFSTQSCVEKLNNKIVYPGMTIELACEQCKAMIALTTLLNVVKEASEKPGPLLQCIVCHNTESPAGAVARQWNRGRCKFCAGYFKVIRA